jgi:CRISPR-associated protein Csm2
MGIMLDLTQRINNGTIPNLNESSLKPEDYAVPNGYADKIAEEIANAKEEMKVTQLRKLFTKIKNIQNKIKTNADLNKYKNEIMLILPELAYARGRKLITEDFYSLIKSCLLKSINNQNQIRFTSKSEFDNFVKFLEAILAYYKKHSLKKS